MTDLHNRHCVACSGAEAPMAEDELQRQLQYLNGWNIVEDGGTRKLVKVFTFSDFNKAIGFSVEVGKLAESEGHHPAILTEWGKVTVSWWTHASGGIHLNDLIMASKTDRL
ncbi:MAG: 4a-hydroxytetrahydrobiopterin dehydratase [Chlorobiaceae bacterium]|nr:4a-hydroxytetrahydrobiopterin dehydratase [Chlorobiaceae bacterium]